VNDFTALAMALPAFKPDDLLQIGGGKPVPHAVSGVLGPGTGLGVSGVIPTVDGFVTLGSEGGHVNFAPADEREFAILQYAWREWQHVSNERLISGPGMEIIYRALALRNGVDAPARDAAEIVSCALEQNDPLCLEVLECFCRHAGRRGGQPGGDAGRLRRHLHRRRHRAAHGAVVRDVAVPRALRSQGPLLELPGADPDLCDHDAEPGLHGVASILSEHLRGPQRRQYADGARAAPAGNCRRPSSASPPWCSSIRARCCPSRSPRSRSWPTSASRP
jgi:glucokinase